MNDKASLFTAKLQHALELIHEAFAMYELEVGQMNDVDDAIDNIENTAQWVEPTYGVQED